MRELATATVISVNHSCGHTCVGAVAWWTAPQFPFLVPQHTHTHSEHACTHTYTHILVFIPLWGTPVSTVQFGDHGFWTSYNNHNYTRLRAQCPCTHTHTHTHTHTNTYMYSVHTYTQIYTRTHTYTDSRSVGGFDCASALSRRGGGGVTALREQVEQHVRASHAPPPPPPSPPHLLHLPPASQGSSFPLPVLLSLSPLSCLQLSPVPV